MLNSLRTVVEARMPQLFAYSCVLFDQMAARDPGNEVNLLPLFVAAGDAVCDVGANRGLYTYWLLQSGARVTAFEPNPHMTGVLRRRFGDALRRGQLRLVESALSDHAGTARLHIPKGLSPLATLDGRLAEADLPMACVDVAVARLDDCVGGDIAFLKVDVEGHELKVLAGAERLLRTAGPTILVEAKERHRPGAARRAGAAGL